MKPENGLVLLYSFLWLREFERGEEGDRKGRPVCCQILLKATPRMPNPVILLPITSQTPTEADDAILIPQLEARRVGLRSPAWLIVNHLNFEPDFQSSPWIEDPKPFGAFSAAFTEQIRECARKALRDRRMQSVPRNQRDVKK